MNKFDDNKFDTFIEGDFEYEDVDNFNGVSNKNSVNNSIHDNYKKNNKKKSSGRKKNNGDGFVRFYAYLMTVVVAALTISTSYFAGKSKGGTTVIYQGQQDTKEKNKSNKNEVVEDSELKEMVKDYMENGLGTMSMLRELYPENIVIYNNNKYMFLDIYDNLEKNELNQENFKKDSSGEITYEEDGKVVSKKGIDVSKYQGDIDWKKVKASGVDFAMIRVGYRGYGTGAIVEDEKARANIEGATAAGIKVGVYFFSQAITEDEAVEEAEFVINIIKDYNIDYPVAFDTEDIPGDKTRTDELSIQERTNIAKKFCQTIENEDYIPCVYANLKWFVLALDLSELEDYRLWLAGYDTDLYFPYKLDIWQYTESGTVNGVNTTVDMNICFEKY